MKLQLIGTKQLMFEVQRFLFTAVAVFGVTSERSTNMCHMGTDLMGASGVQGDFCQTKTVLLLQHPIFRDDFPIACFWTVGNGNRIRLCIFPVISVQDVGLLRRRCSQNAEIRLLDTVFPNQAVQFP